MLGSHIFVVYKIIFNNFVEFPRRPTNRFIQKILFSIYINLL